MLRMVLDTNQFVSSVLVRQGLPAQVLDAWRRREFLLITSPFIIAEIRSTFSYLRTDSASFRPWPTANRRGSEYLVPTA